MHDIEIMMSQCPDLDFCIAFGKNRKRLRQFFDYFQTFDYATSARTISEGVDGKLLAIQFAKPLPSGNDYAHDHARLEYVAALKIPKEMSREAFTEIMYIGNINKLAYRFPNFIVIFGVIRFDIADERDKLYSLDWSWSDSTVFPLEKLIMKPNGKITGIMMEYIVPQKRMFIDAIVNDVGKLFTVNKGVRTMTEKTVENDLIRLTHELVCVFYQIYFPLTRSCLIHKDLHYHNVLLYRNHEMEYFSFHYHETDDEMSPSFSFDSQLIPKIIDFGRSEFVPSVEKKKEKRYDDLEDLSYVLQCVTSKNGFILPDINYQLLAKQVSGTECETEWTNYSEENRQNFLDMISTFFPKKDTPGEYNLEMIRYFLHYCQYDKIMKSLSQFVVKLQDLMKELVPFDFARDPSMRKKGDMHVYPTRPFNFVQYIQIVKLTIHDDDDAFAYESEDGQRFKLHLFEVFNVLQLDPNKLLMRIASDTFTNTDFVLEFIGDTAGDDDQSMATLLHKNIEKYRVIAKEDEGESVQESIRVIGINDAGILWKRYRKFDMQDRMIAFHDFSTIRRNGDTQLFLEKMGGHVQSKTVLTFKAQSQRDFWFHGFEKAIQRRKHELDEQRRKEEKELAERKEAKELAERKEAVVAGEKRRKQKLAEEEQKKQKEKEIEADFEKSLGTIEKQTEVGNNNTQRTKPANSFFSVFQRRTFRLFRNAYNKTRHYRTYVKYKDVKGEYDDLIKTSLKYITTSLSFSDLRRKNDIADEKKMAEQLTTLKSQYDKQLVVGDDDAIRKNKKKVDYLISFWWKYTAWREGTIKEWKKLDADVTHMDLYRRNLEEILDEVLFRNSNYNEEKLKGFFKSLYHLCKLLYTFIDTFYNVDTRYSVHMLNHLANSFKIKLLNWFEQKEKDGQKGGGNIARTVNKSTRRKKAKNR